MPAGLHGEALQYNLFNYKSACYSERGGKERNPRNFHILLTCTVWSFTAAIPNLYQDPPPPHRYPASEITASQPQSRDAVCLVIWWLIPCLFPTNLFTDKGVASTLVNMGASADCQTREPVEEMEDRGEKKNSSLCSTGKPLSIFGMSTNMPLWMFKLWKCLQAF